MDKKTQSDHTAAHHARTTRAVVRLDPGDRAAWEDLAAAAGTNKTELLRRWIRAGKLPGPASK